jgi:cytochrome b6-f complex iron-sulfur subunit
LCSFSAELMRQNVCSAEGMPETSQTRRAFCAQACQLVTLAGAATVLASCGGGPGSSVDIGTSLPVINGSRVNGVTTVTIDSASPLNSVGGMAFVQASGAAFLVTRTAADACTALTAACTHQACTVSNGSAGVFTCPCHGSQFDPAGRVVRGPATAPLHEFQSALVNNTLTING